MTLKEHEGYYTNLEAWRDDAVGTLLQDYVGPKDCDPKRWTCRKNAIWLNDQVDASVEATEMQTKENVDWQRGRGLEQDGKANGEEPQPVDSNFGRGHILPRDVGQ